MRNVWAICRRELKAYFASPIAYVVLAFFVLIYGFLFSSGVEWFMRLSLQGTQYGFNRALNINEYLIRGLFLNAGVLAVFMLPVITMRTFAEENRSGTIELLLTSPITDAQIVFGKFLAALILYAAMLGLTLIHAGLLFYFGDPEWRPLVAGYLGLLLLGGAFIAFGILFSSFTRNQIVAGFLALGAFLFLWLIQYMEEWGGTWGSFFAYLSVTKHLEEFAKGVIDTKDVVYYLSFIGLGLFLSKQSVESHRWRG